jgi:hypothetical protein
MLNQRPDVAENGMAAFGAWQAEADVRCFII